jgi:hypothetical protein
MNGIIQPGGRRHWRCRSRSSIAQGTAGGGADLDLARQVSQMPHYSSIPDYDHRAAVVAPGLAAMVDTNDRAPVSGALMYVKDDGVSPKLVCASECNRPGRKILGRVVGRYRVPEEVPFNLPGDA